MKTYPRPFIHWRNQLHHLPYPFSHHQCCSLPCCSFTLGSKQSAFYADHPLSTGLPWAYQAATTFSSSSLTVNVSWSSLADRDNTVAQSSPQGEDSDATLVPTVPSIPVIPSTPPPHHTTKWTPLPQIPSYSPSQPCDEGTLSYLPPGWPLSLPPTMFAPHWEQLQSGALYLPLILWNLFWPPLQPHHPQAWMIVPILHKSHPLPSLFLQDPATQVQLFWTDAIHVSWQTTSIQTVPIIVVPPVDEPFQDTPTTNVPNFIASTVSNMVTPVSSAHTLHPLTTIPSWTQPRTSPTMRSMREIGVLEMALQDYEEGNITDIWDPPPCSSLPPSLPSHTLWDMIMNNKEISLEIWD